jgi:hypothetical protein
LTTYAIAPASRARSTLGEGGQEHHRRAAVLPDPLGRRDAVELGHLDVHHDHVGLELRSELHGGFAVARLADDVEPAVAERLDDVHADQSLVLGHDRAAGRGARLRSRLRLGRELGLEQRGEVEGKGVRVGGGVVGHGPMVVPRAGPRRPVV